MSPARPFQAGRAAFEAASDLADCWRCGRTKATHDPASMRCREHEGVFAIDANAGVAFKSGTYPAIETAADGSTVNPDMRATVLDIPVTMEVDTGSLLGDMSVDVPRVYPLIGEVVVRVRVTRDERPEGIMLTATVPVLAGLLIRKEASEAEIATYARQVAGDLVRDIEGRR